MGARSAALAVEFTRASDAAVAAAASLSAADWQRATADGTTVGVVFNQIAESYATDGYLIVQLVAGAQPATQTQGQLEAANASASRLAEDVTPADVLARLQQNGAMLVTMLNALDDDTLQNAAPVALDGPPLTVQQIIERNLIGQIAERLQRVRATLEAN